VNRRQFLTALSSASGVFIASGSKASVAPEREPLDPMPRDRPFLHVMDHEVFLPTRNSLVRPGYVLTVTPGVGPWDDLHLLRDGTLAAVAVAFRHEDVHIHCYENVWHGNVPSARANDLIAGRVIKIIRQDRGKWIE